VTPDPVFQNFLTAYLKKTQNPAGVDSGTQDPWQPLLGDANVKRIEDFAILIQSNIFIV